MHAGSCQRPLRDPDGIGSAQSALHREPRAPSPAWQKMYVYVWACVCVKEAWEELRVVSLSFPLNIMDSTQVNQYQQYLVA